MPMHCAADNLHPGVVKLLLKSCTPEALNAVDVQVLLSLSHDACYMAHDLWAREAQRLPVYSTHACAVCIVLQKAHGSN